MTSCLPASRGTQNAWITASPIEGGDSTHGCPIAGPVASGMGSEPSKTVSAVALGARPVAPAEHRRMSTCVPVGITMSLAVTMSRSG